MRGPFKNILCPLDFDDQSLAAVEIARQALAPEGHLWFLHLRSFPFALTREEAEVPLSASKEKLEGLLAERIGSSVKYEVLVASSDDFSRSIVDAAQELDADCVVLATHARHGVDKVLLGSVAEEVIREARCPVLTIARPASEETKS
jgi:nucleotide-binding universal stress UspA family protein